MSGDSNGYAACINKINAKQWNILQLLNTVTFSEIIGLLSKKKRIEHLVKNKEKL